MRQLILSLRVLMISYLKEVETVKNNCTTPNLRASQSGRTLQDFWRTETAIISPFISCRSLLVSSSSSVNSANCELSCHPTHKSLTYHHYFVTSSSSASPTYSELSQQLVSFFLYSCFFFLCSSYKSNKQQHCNAKDMI